jgi:hypothetical protein
MVKFSAVMETVTPLAAVAPSLGSSKATLASLSYSIGASLAPASSFPPDGHPAS